MRHYLLIIFIEDIYRGYVTPQELRSWESAYLLASAVCLMEYEVIFVHLFMSECLALGQLHQKRFALVIFELTPLARLDLLALSLTFSAAFHVFYLVYFE